MSMSFKMKIEEIIQKFELEPHPEGGFYKRTFLSDDESFSSILFLLLKDNFSAFHKIKSDEQWNWYGGDAIVIHEIDTNGNYNKTILSDEKLNFNSDLSLVNIKSLFSDMVPLKKFIAGLPINPATN